MCVPGAGVGGEIVLGSPADLAAVIKNDSAYQKRHNVHNEVLNSFTDRDTALVWAKARTQEVNNVHPPEERRNTTTRDDTHGFDCDPQHFNLSNRS